jgi:hypothetical protein
MLGVVRADDSVAMLTTPKSPPKTPSTPTPSTSPGARSRTDGAVSKSPSPSKAAQSPSKSEASPSTPRRVPIVPPLGKTPPPPPGLVDGMDALLKRKLDAGIITEDEYRHLLRVQDRATVEEGDLRARSLTQSSDARGLTPPRSITPELHPRSATPPLVPPPNTRTSSGEQDRSRGGETRLDDALMVTTSASPRLTRHGISSASGALDDDEDTGVRGITPGSARLRGACPSPPPTQSSVTTEVSDGSGGEAEQRWCDLVGAAGQVPEVPAAGTVVHRQRRSSF